MKLFVCYPKCSTCRKAQKHLDEHGIVYTFRDIKEERPSAEELKEWIRMSGLSPRRFFNTSGIKYRELGLKEKLKTMDEEEMIRLLSEDGMLVKRPLLICDEKILVGYRPEEYEKL